MIQVRQRRERDPNAPNRFEPGDLVRHRKYGYRGVVVEFDLGCRASEAWYRSNRSQPKRDQPWYHVLVHDAVHTTYAAEENPVAETEPAPVEHPWVVVFFDAYLGDRYRRNGRSWDGG